MADDDDDGMTPIERAYQTARKRLATPLAEASTAARKLDQDQIRDRDHWRYHIGTIVEYLTDLHPADVYTVCHIVIALLQMQSRKDFEALHGRPQDVASRGVPSGEDEGVRRMSGARNPFVPVVTTRCADCGVGTHSIDEWYMVKDDVWEQAWAGRRKSWHSLPGQQILCIGCLEERIGRTLTCHDFTDAPVNDPHESNISARLRDRLTTNENALLRTAMR